MSNKDKTNNSESIEQLCGFRIGSNLYGLSVTEVQEVIKPQRVTIVPKSPDHIRGLINLRGQIVTQISLRKIFGLNEDYKQDYMNIIISRGDSLFALVVDEILDVTDVSSSTFEDTPNTVDKKIIGYIKGVYKLSEGLQIIIDSDKIISLEKSKR
ncbi:MAG: chemotaxis protein CheW [Bdellovibrionales bacterium]|jgi:purine-binding chemotaxis protein CheW|nr:chemotaxis protein CheW [Bdellovibrionales bacterium]